MIGETLCMHIPCVTPRQPLYDDQPDGYLESDNDWARSNWDFVMWALDNHEQIRQAITAQVTERERCAQIAENYKCENGLALLGAPSVIAAQIRS